MHALGALPFSDAVEGPSPALDRLVNWFSNGARVAEQRQRWPSIVHAAPHIAMIYPTRSKLLLGVVTPTVTAGQRPFAFGVFDECADPTVRPFSAALPIAERGFFDDCAALVTACRADASWDDVRARVGDLPGLDLARHKAIAENFLATSAREGGARLVRTMLDPDGATAMSSAATTSALFRAVRERVRSGRGPRAVRLPLHPYELGATVLIWVALVRTAARWTEHVPQVCWTVRSERPWVQIELTNDLSAEPFPDAELFASLWTETPEPTAVLDFVGSHEGDSHSPPFDPIRACFERTSATIGDLLSAFVAIP